MDWAAVEAVREAPLGDPAFDDEAGHGVVRKLRGVRYSVGDNIDVEGQWTRSGTPGLGHRLPVEDASVVARLRRAGAVLTGRTRVDELAWGVTTPGCAHPLDPRRNAGGASGGAAVSVADGTAALALGTDTGGSLRVPAALCGVAGLRPTAGTVSRRGVTPLAPSLDTVGPLARTAAECLAAYRVLGGIVTPAPENVDGLRVGWPGHLWEHHVSPAVAAVLAHTAAGLRAAGVDLVTIALPLARSHAQAAASVITLAEAAALWSGPLAGQPDGLTEPMSALIREGALVSTTDYLRALRVTAAVRRELEEVLSRQGLSALLVPTVPVTATWEDATSVSVNGHAEPLESAYTRLTALASVTGHPALSVPAGTDGDGLPIGAQLIGPPHGEAALCLLGSAIERPLRFPR
ncbi:amidase [Amycolatopsis sp. NPDC059657]|uniref:amidase n=1 Tax=Amycolatopsis sp. NPDC059657 TaxID=3346899 RepID=UPI00366C0D7A